MPKGTPARWALRHGLALAVLKTRGKHEIQARFITNPAVRADPYPFYDEIRAAGPLVHGRLGVLSASHAVATTVLRSDAFSAGLDAARIPPAIRRAMKATRNERILGPLDPPSLLVVDPPDHTRYRRLVSNVFTVRAIEAMRPRIELVAADLLDQMAAESTVDLVARYASLLPVTIIAEILGVPVAQRAQFLEWGGAAAPTLDLGLRYRDFRRAEIAIEALSDWMRGHFARLRADPGSDILSKLVTLTDDGERLTEVELLAIANLVLAAGFETTVNLLGNGAVLLMRHPDQVAVLRAEPALWANAADEVLRYDAPVQVTGRTSTRDTEILGERVPAGRMVVTLLGGANRDPAVFTDPNAFDVRRANAREHVAFSSGVHYCLGAALARMEGEIGLRALFDRFPDLALAGEPVRRPTRVLRGYAVLPVAPGGVRRAA
jgi:cytochrome P450